jgi:CRP/FNR family cyclic AMP-dependent transcriptional regulator
MPYQVFVEGEDTDSADDSESQKDICAMSDTNDEQKNKETRFDLQAFLAKHGGGTISKYYEHEAVYAQGDPADAVFYIVNGAVKVTIVSEHGKEAVIAILGAGDFFGEGCLDGLLLRNSTITATTACEIARFDRKTIINALNDDPAFSHVFIGFVLDRNQKLQADLIDQLFNSSEKRLARILMTLASSGLDDQSSMITIPITEETLAHMVGTTRSRVNQFMTRFRKLGYIEYNGQIRVHNSLLNIILNGRSHSAER